MSKWYGSTVRWLPTSGVGEAVPETPGPLTLVIHILPRGPPGDKPNQMRLDWLWRRRRRFGRVAGVFHDRVKRLDTTISEAVALGTVTAHELGHLLLGTGRHTAIGIMKHDWRQKQIVLAAQGLLRFDPGERVRILRNMGRRILASKLKPAR